MSYMSHSSSVLNFDDNPDDFLGLDSELAAIYLTGLEIDANHNTNLSNNYSPLPHLLMDFTGEELEFIIQAYINSGINLAEEINKSVLYLNVVLTKLQNNEKYKYACLVVNATLSNMNLKNMSPSVALNIAMYSSSQYEMPEQYLKSKTPTELIFSSGHQVPSTSPLPKNNSMLPPATSAVLDSGKPPLYPDTNSSNSKRLKKPS